MLCATLYAQSVEPDPRLFDRYSESYLFSRNEDSPQFVPLKNYEVEFGYELVLLDADKVSAYAPLKFYNYLTSELGEEVSSVDTENFNLYKYWYERKYSKRSFYRIGDTNWALMIYSGKEFVENFNKLKDE